MVFGTRPEAVKLGPVVAALRAAGEVPEIVCSGQHTDLLRGTPADDGLAPTASLSLPGTNEPFAYSDQCFHAFRARWDRNGPTPELVIVQGDTATAHAAALAAHRLDIPVAHVEAGIRSRDACDPWPEETFRTAIDAASKWLFCATDRNLLNVVNEPDKYAFVKQPRFYVTGNTGIDALYAHTQPLEHPRKVQDRVLITLHRRESFGEPLRQTVHGILQACQKYPQIEFVWPTHPNPEVQKALPSDGACPANLQLLPALGMVAFARMLAASRAVLSDSGGVQEESAALGVPCVVARDRTDRPESVAVGLAKVAGRTAEGILDGLGWALGFQARATPSDCFGDGHAAERIVSHLLNCQHS